MLASIKTELKRWSSGNLPWFGCCSAIKMTVFPRLLYLFQWLPIKVPPAFLREVNRVFANCIWNYKPPTTSFMTLRRTKRQGGTRLVQTCHFKTVGGREALVITNITTCSSVVWIRTSFLNKTTSHYRYDVGKMPDALLDREDLTSLSHYRLSPSRWAPTWNL